MKTDIVNYDLLNAIDIFKSSWTQNNNFSSHSSSCMNNDYDKFSFESRYNFFKAKQE